MNQDSEIILEKMIDHFGELEEPTLKKKMNFKKKQKKVSKEKEFINSININLDNELVRERRDELLLFIEELKVLNSSQPTKHEAPSDVYSKARQEEIIYVKKVLQAEIRSTSFITAY